MKFLHIAGCVALAGASASHATIIGGTVTGGAALGQGGVFVKLGIPLGNPFGPPNSVGDDTFQSPNLYGFDEDQNILLTNPLDIDVGPSPVAAGTTVASHYIFFDPGPTTTITGTVDFDSDVFGIITSTGLLLASDFLANTGVNYLNPTLRGLEPSQDTVSISGARQITVNYQASTPGDYIRVLTQYSPGAVPEPASWAMMIAGFALAGGLARRRQPRVARA